MPQQTRAIPCILLAEEGSPSLVKITNAHVGTDNQDI